MYFMVNLVSPVSKNEKERKKPRNQRLWSIKELQSFVSFSVYHEVYLPWQSHCTVLLLTLERDSFFVNSSKNFFHDFI